jgi:hypothetical protein
VEKKKLSREKVEPLSLEKGHWFVNKKKNLSSPKQPEWWWKASQGGDSSTLK